MSRTCKRLVCECIRWWPNYIIATSLERWTPTWKNVSNVQLNSGVFHLFQARLKFDLGSGCVCTMLPMTGRQPVVEFATSPRPLQLPILPFYDSSSTPGYILVSFNSDSLYPSPFYPSSLQHWWSHQNRRERLFTTDVNDLYISFVYLSCTIWVYHSSKKTLIYESAYGRLELHAAFIYIYLHVLSFDRTLNFFENLGDICLSRRTPPVRVGCPF